MSVDADSLPPTWVQMLTAYTIKATYAANLY